MWSRRSGSQENPLELNLHDHVALICGLPDHWRRLAMAFIKDGLRLGHQILYLNGLYPAEQVYALLEREGHPVREARSSGQLKIMPANQFFLPDGYLDPSGTLSLLASAVEHGQRRNRPTLRLLVDMNWACYMSGGLAGLLEIERLLGDTFLPQYPCLAVCHYERVLFAPEVLELIVGLHPRVIDGYRVLGGLPRPARRPGADLLNSLAPFRAPRGLPAAS